MARPRMRDVLLKMGFQEDPSVISDFPGGLSLKHGNVELYASHCLGRHFTEVIMLSGNITSRRELTLVQHELPLDVGSVEQGIALVAYYLDSTTSRGEFPETLLRWLSIGRDNKHLLPWEKERREYEARPRCCIAREHARAMFKHLGQQLAQTPDDAMVLIDFDGHAIRFSVGEQSIDAPAAGKPWGVTFGIKVVDLNFLPKRLMRDPVEISIWIGGLNIGKRRLARIIHMS